MIKLPVHVGKAYKDDLRDADNECVLFLVGPDRESDAKQTADALNAYEANQALIKQLVEALGALRVQALQSDVNSTSNEWGMESLHKAFCALDAARKAGF